MKRDWLLFIAAVICSLLLAEGLIRAYYALGHKIPPHRDRSVYEEWKWVSEHLAAGSAYLPGRAMYDAVLGWVIKPNLNMDGVRTNSAGIRSDREFSRERVPGTPRILFVGDSYTFGDGIANEYTFQTVLEETYLRGWEVLNLGVSGYGPDQALLRYETAGTAYRPDVVVFGFYPRGFFRLFSRFRFYAKPCFVLDESGRLKLENVPVISPDKLYGAYVAGRRRIGGRHYSYLAEMIRSRASRTLERKRIGDRGDESWRLMTKILARFREQAVKDGAHPLLLIFPVRPDHYEDTVYEDLDLLAQEEARRLGMPCLSMTGPFLSRFDQSPREPLFRDQAVGGHLSVQGHRLVAELVYKSLQAQGIIPAAGQKKGL